MTTLTAATDTVLVGQFRDLRSEAAFAEIVSRHGALVYRACLRALGNSADAEDAAQATFLVLAQRCGNVNGPLVPWLLGVSQRVAHNLLVARARRRRRENEVAVAKVAVVNPTTGLREELDAAIAQLPPKLAEAVSLRYLEGRSQQEAAELAGCPQGTLGRRAKEGIDRLRSILTRRGVVVAPALLFGFLAQQQALAVPVTLTSKLALAAGATAAGTTISAQVGVLAKAATKAMFWAKVKLYTVVTASAVAVAAVPAAYVALKPAEKGLVGHYRFAEGRGTTVRDESAGGNHGQLNGGVAWAAGPKSGSRALDFDGTNGRVQLAQDVSPWLGGTATVAYWIKTAQVGDGDSTSPALIGADVPDDNDVVYGWLDNAGRIGVVAGGGPPGGRGPQLSAQSKQPINDGRWHHVAMTRNADSGEVQMFVDGVFQNKAVSGIGKKTTPLTVLGRFEQRDQQEHYFRGAIAELRLYSRVLSAEEIGRLAQ
jgi:RNA polymerase sigma factor (sigma-70 family)